LLVRGSRRPSRVITASSAIDRPAPRLTIERNRNNAAGLAECALHGDASLDLIERAA
jgi:hypothetical protein